jgi:RimJ/RimL family protein N-acetyltransferase
VTDLAGAWPPAPIRTERLVLRRSEAGDRAALIELLSSPEVHRYLGGPSSRVELERTAPEIPGRRPGFFVVEADGAAIGMITLDPRAADRPGPAGGTELGYLFLPDAWGHGYATEAGAAVLAWFAGVRPGEPVLLCTQTANAASVRLAIRLGFAEVARFEEFGAEQWFGRWTPVTPAG